MSKLHIAYSHESTDLEPWASSTSFSIVNDENLYEHLGDISYALSFRGACFKYEINEFRYQETFINYFDLKLAHFDGDWKANTFFKVLNHSLAVLCAGSGTLLYN